MGLTVVIADDHETARAGIKQFLAGSDIRIVGEASTGEAVLKLTKKHAPDVVVLEVWWPDADGMTILHRLRKEHPSTPVLVFSGLDNPILAAKAVALGASGYLLKKTGKKEFLEAVRAVSAGSSLWRSSQLRRVGRALAAPQMPTRLEIQLTERESETLKHVVEGRTNREISFAMKISTETVKEHVQHMLRKLGVTDRTQAAVLAVRSGMV